MAASSHLVIPGQLIAVSQDGNEESSFLRGHGTYIEQGDDNNSKNNSSSGELYLRASVTGTVQRVNKLISVIPLTVNRYEGHVGDLVVGRVMAVSLNRWKVQLSWHQQSAALPLSGVYLADGAQRVRTQQDAREMRALLKEGDLVSAEVHKILHTDGTLQLHTRSTRYGKLENGCLVQVPPGRVPKRKNHYVTNFMGQFDVLLGCNGWIWMQKTTNVASTTTTTDSGGDAAAAAALQGPELAEVQQAARAQHAATPYSVEERQALARLRNSVECLRLTAAPVTVEHMEQVFQLSLQQKQQQPQQQLPPAAMLEPQNVLRLTEHIREKQ